MGSAVKRQMGKWNSLKLMFTGQQKPKICLFKGIIYIITKRLAIKNVNIKLTDV
jgi:hypothetical protein